MQIIIIRLFLITLKIYIIIEINLSRFIKNQIKKTNIFEWRPNINLPITLNLLRSNNTRSNINLHNTIKLLRSTINLPKTIKLLRSIINLPKTIKLLNSNYRIKIISFIRSNIDLSKTTKLFRLNIGIPIPKTIKLLNSNYRTKITRYNWFW